MTACPCGSKQKYEKCCGHFIEDEKNYPNTAEKLMRSRYVAYTQSKIDYIQKTMRGKPAEDFNVPNVQQWAKQCEWLPLNVMKTWEEGEKHFVEFSTGYAFNGVKEHMHEISEFQRADDGRLYYLDGESIKLSRNDPCFCGSGKKLKKCCLQALCFLSLWCLMVAFQAPRSWTLPGYIFLLSYAVGNYRGRQNWCQLKAQVGCWQIVGMCL